MSKEEIKEQLRCLRMHLFETLQKVEDFEKKLERPGTVSTNPETTSSKKYSQGKRTTKKTAYNKYLNR